MLKVDRNDLEHILDFHNYFRSRKYYPSGALACQKEHY